MLLSMYFAIKRTKATTDTQQHSKDRQALTQQAGSNHCDLCFAAFCCDIASDVLKLSSPATRSDL